MIREFLRDEQGQDVVEYSLLLVLIGAAAVFVITAMGTSVKNIFNQLSSKLDSANSGAANSGK
ncbi:MAG TPA: Flp family type IVb pilin [Blastocatellia bacterium]|nr:Flp family type IVb pilin [Blastocatellia bacterium]